MSCTPHGGARRPLNRTHFVSRYLKELSMYMKIALGLPLLTAACLFGLTRPAVGSVRLITLPPGERVEVQFDNPNVTLVEEERLVPLNAGVNASCSAGPMPISTRSAFGSAV